MMNPATRPAADTQVDGEVCYLLAFPSNATRLPYPPQRVKGLKDAPYFDAVAIDIRTLSDQVIRVGAVDVAVRRQVYDGLIEIAECIFPLRDVLGPAALETKAAIQTALRAELTADRPGLAEPTEEYTALLLRDARPAPDAFVEAAGQALARFIRTHSETFEHRELTDILVSRVRYSDRHLTVVDWDGAIVIAPDGDFRSDIELLKIGNYQLLHYRMIDETIERNLQAVRQHMGEGTRPAFLPTPAQRVLREALEQRLSLVLDFERIDQGLLLIGDWYTAKLYQAIYEEFYLDEWKTVIKAKLDSLESITQIIQENFAFSWKRFFDLTELTGWLVLLIGYFILFYLESQ
jgi:hypothetical protein